MARLDRTDVFFLALSAASLLLVIAVWLASPGQKSTGVFQSSSSSTIRDSVKLAQNINFGSKGSFLSIGSLGSIASIGGPSLSNTAAGHLTVALRNYEFMCCPKLKARVACRRFHRQHSVDRFGRVRFVSGLDWWRRHNVCNFGCLELWRLQPCLLQGLAIWCRPTVSQAQAQAHLNALA